MPRSTANSRVTAANRAAANNRVQGSAASILFQDDFSSGSLANYTVVAGTWSVISSVLTCTAAPANAWNNRMIVTNNSSFGDFDATIRIRKPTFNVMFAFRSGTTTGSGYGVQLRDTNNFRLERWGSANLVNTTPITWVTGTWYKVRVRCQGSSIKAKVWPDGAAEPGLWNIETSNTEFSSGRFGFSGESSSGASEYDDLIVSEAVGRVQIS